jgi:lysophospholipid acyltransferase (LPLAT)-like uncharacterized protein
VSRRRYGRGEAGAEERGTRGALPLADKAVDDGRRGDVAAQRDRRLDQHIGERHRLAELPWVETPGTGMVRISAHRSKQRAQLPDVARDYELGPEIAARRRRQHARKAAVLEPSPFVPYRTPDGSHGAAGAQGGREPPFREHERLTRGEVGCDSDEREPQAREVVRKVLLAEPDEAAVREQSRPEDAARHVSHLAPAHSRGEHRAGEAPGARARDRHGTDAGLLERFDDADMCETANAAAAQREPDTVREYTLFEMSHQSEEYTAAASGRDTTLAARLDAIHERIGHESAWRQLDDAERGRNTVTRALDWLLDIVAWLPPLRWLLTTSIGAVLYLYARLVAVTARYVEVGQSLSSATEAPCVVALWHGRAPSFLAALAARRLPGRTAIMIARGPRGDAIAQLCRWLGLEVVRGDDRHEGWEALVELAARVAEGARAVMTVDGAGPARVVKRGALVLASATGAPVVAVSAACSPALSLKRKWDAATNPVPFGRVAVAAGPAIRAPGLEDTAELERESQALRRALDEASDAADAALSGA